MTTGKIKKAERMLGKELPNEEKRQNADVY